MTASVLERLTIGYGYPSTVSVNRPGLSTCPFWIGLTASW